ncbi:MAG: glycosyltransferase family 4 protein [Gammaproteobacteria bacterium]|jgi:Fuc2NAc and GlcNAc transferase|nr:glycosyltransferase family 4 protein [Gammaproteobacteria bacterium]MBT6548247.1 glycosyltransferase family 4 protein [Gammaproteobacteria bacterium]MDC1268299.1 glycosyltransferase family 4 protein [Gammaproteobacteria bacterium]MDG1180196.1 glycosyltransferase family 4 protein [Gammaproteobacteria bacterium]MDG1515404.1 glycosyltransferase family 4 protein [Gammaproteobacteria bacterium]
MGAIDVMFLFIVSLSSFALVAVLSAGVIRYGPRFGLLDTPVARSAHVAPKPLGGGAALAAPYFLCVIWFVASAAISESALAYLGCLFIVVLGFSDDRWQLSSKVRLPVQFIVSLAAVRAIGVDSVDFGFFSLSEPLTLSLLAVLSLVWLCNLTNFMDGIDGIAASQLLVTSLSCVVLLVGLDAAAGESGEHDVVLTLSVVLAASAAGFLLWNWSPASLFMGDAGSGFIGFALGLLALESLVTQRMAVWSWVLLLGVFIADTAVTLLVRIIRGERWYEGHSQHAYQILSRRLNSHPRVVGGVILINICWLLPLAWVAGILPHYGVLFATIGLAPLLLGCYRLGAGRADAGEAPIQLN